MLLTGLVLSLFLLLFLLWQSLCAFLFFRMNARGSANHGALPSLSVIVPVRNEAARLPHSLSAIANQEYPGATFEVILVDDHSTDDSARLLRDFTATHSSAKTISNRGEGKKAALETGIAAATGEIILSTDADCRPGPGWAASMARSFAADTHLVAGPVEMGGDSWLQKLQALELTGLIALSAGSISLGLPTMVNGANLAFRKRVFEAIGGYEGIDQVASGDDELLIQKMRQRGFRNIRYCKDRDAIVETAGPDDIRTLLRQRLRWVSKVRHYTDRRINLIQMVSWLGFAAFPVLLLAGFWDARAWPVLLTLALIKLLADLAIMVPATSFFNSRNLLRYLPLLELVYIPYLLWIGVAGNRIRSYTWKERTVR